MKNPELYQFYNDIENMILCSSSNTDEFLTKMKRIDFLFENFDQIMKEFSDSINEININDYIIKDRWYDKIFKKINSIRIGLFPS